MRLDLNDPRQYCEFHARKLSAESGNQYAIFRAMVDEYGDDWRIMLDNDCPPLPYVEGCLFYTVNEG